jgi:hypothetical protein
MLFAIPKRAVANVTPAEESTTKIRHRQQIDIEKAPKDGVSNYGRILYKHMETTSGKTSPVARR